jgi:hypothetical protein
MIARLRFEGELGFEVVAVAYVSVAVKEKAGLRRAQDDSLRNSEIF